MTTVTSTEQLPFTIDPKEIIDRMRFSWIGQIQAGEHAMLERVLPYLEMEAVRRFEREYTIDKSWLPKIEDGFEDWRLWWLNEAFQNCDIHSPVGCAGNHLTQIGQSAVNILMAASALRDAIESGKAEESAAIAMLLICEVIAGGYSLKFDEIKESKKQAYEAGVGKEHSGLIKARKASVAFAKKTWKEQPEMRIGVMANNILKRLIEKKELFPAMESFPKVNTIKTWLREAGASGRLAIPEAAQRAGRSARA